MGWTDAGLVCLYVVLHGGAAWLVWKFVFKTKKDNVPDAAAYWKQSRAA